MQPALEKDSCHGGRGPTMSEKKERRNDGRENSQFLEDSSSAFSERFGLAIFLGQMYD